MLTFFQIVSVTDLATEDAKGLVNLVHSLLNGAGFLLRLEDSPKGCRYFVVRTLTDYLAAQGGAVTDSRTQRSRLTGWRSFLHGLRQLQYN